MKSYHRVWLSVHRDRDPVWLQQKINEGFSIHHLDFNHNNNEPDNLILIENTDHVMIHAGKRAKPILTTKSKRKKSKLKKAAK